MLTIAEKLGFMKAGTVKVWTEAGISSSLESTNLVFRINLQENGLGEGIERENMKTRIVALCLILELFQQEYL